MPRGVYKRKPAKKSPVKSRKRRNHPGVRDTGEDIPSISRSSLVRSEIVPASGGDGHRVHIKKGDTLIITFG